MLVTFQVQQPYNSTETTFDSTSLSFRSGLRFELRQTEDKISKADLAFLMSKSAAARIDFIAKICKFVNCFNLLITYLNKSICILCQAYGFRFTAVNCKTSRSHHNLKGLQLHR